MRAFALLAVLGVAACNGAPPAETLSLQGQLEREGVEDTNEQDVAVDYTSTGARGEWWSCELRMTASGCVGNKHVNAWIALPNIQHLDDLGGTGCVDGDGHPTGAFEILSQKVQAGDPIEIPGDVSVLFLVASDADGDGVANLADDKETFAASRLLNGVVELKGLGSFTDPVALTISGLTAVDSLQIDLAMNGPTSPVTNPPTLDKPSSCVAAK
ncbi:MAG TPA: hypothetical protein VGO62_17800 [Myxococcota bacterium]|jgi:hypothetical protein